MPLPSRQPAVRQALADLTQEMDKVVVDELKDFQTELDRLYEEVKGEEGGDRLTREIPADEILEKRFLSQLGAHPIPAWPPRLSARGLEPRHSNMALGQHAVATAARILEPPGEPL